MDAFSQEAFALLAIGLFVIGLRLYLRISSAGLKGLHADDYLMVVAAAAYVVETYLAYSVGAFWKGLANNGMTDEQRRLLDPNSEEYRLRVNGSKTQLAGWSTYTFLLWVIKAAMCTLYLRLMENLGFEKRICAGFGIVVTTWVAVLLTILLGCRPFKKNWQIYPDPGNFCQPAISRLDILVTVVLNVLTDIYLMSIPIPMLWMSSLRPFKKAGLILLFSGGIFVTAAAILRCVLIIADPVDGAQKAGSWAVRETFVAVVTSNLPMISPLIARLFRPIIGSLRSLSSSSNKGSRTPGSNDIPLPPGYDLDDKNPRRGMGPRSVHPIPNFSVNGSDEHLYTCHEEESGGTASYDTDLESAQAMHSRAGVIVKQTSVEVIESRHAGGPAHEREDVGDYYLVGQAQRDAERLGRLPEASASAGRRTRTSPTFGIGRAV